MCLLIFLLGLDLGLEILPTGLGFKVGQNTPFYTTDFLYYLKKTNFMSLFEKINNLVCSKISYDYRETNFL